MPGQRRPLRPRHKTKIVLGPAPVLQQRQRRGCHSQGRGWRGIMGGPGSSRRALPPRGNRPHRP
eukprot:1191213-Pyramimonas_sp.AAC.1